MGPSTIAPTADILSQMRNDNGDILTKPFLDLSGSTLPVIGKRGVCETFLLHPNLGHTVPSSLKTWIIKVMQNPPHASPIICSF